ncbi:FAD/NAD(P)-binding protein [Marinactinospora thermotolerans]|uniref:FAD/NAD(P)-binding protein n=1 Tax=Marinactinospora thermotolerans TaxID=531310 RepID=UPI001F37C8D6|nr:FAD/NAD(P)-binding protein [Marinactinospora thermotolerans]
MGAGPRGLSVLERLCANARRDSSHREVTVHLIDSFPPGAGAVWRTDQSRLLLMNTVASQITVYTDDSVQIDGPIEPGPSLYDWAQGLALLGEFDGYDEEILVEARGLGPDSYPTRALYGCYLRACFARIVAGAPANVRVRVHATRALAMADAYGVQGGPQGIRMENGTSLNFLDAIVLAQGHLPVRRSAQQARTTSLARIHGLVYVTPDNPADVDLSGVEAGRPVLLRGLGLNFFDYVTLLTQGRGGRFEERADRLVYHPSGAEPVIYGFSRRGIPYHARGRNQKGAAGRHVPRLFTAATIERLRRLSPEGLSFSRDLWPLIRREVESVYYATLLRSRGDATAAETFTSRFLVEDEAGAVALSTEYGIVPADRWDWRRLGRPHEGRVFTSRAGFQAWLLDHLAQDVRAAEAGNVDGPLKAALDVLRDLRNEVRLAVDHGGLDGRSYRDELQGWYTPLNAFLSIGPPASRIRELIALIEAGVVEITGPGTQVRFDASLPGFVAVSDQVPGPPIRSKALIEARLPEPDLRRVDDPLLTHLLNSDQVVPYRIACQGGGCYETGGLAVTERPYHLVDGRGRVHPRRFAYGVPTEAVHWVTAAGTRPGVDSVTLGDSDAIARSVLALAPAVHVPVGDRVAASRGDLTEVIV